MNPDTPMPKTTHENPNLPSARPPGSDLWIELIARREAMQRICDSVGTDSPERVAELFSLMSEEVMILRKQHRKWENAFKWTPCPHCDGTGHIPNDRTQARRHLSNNKEKGDPGVA